MWRWSAACLMLLLMACSPPPQAVALCDLSGGAFDGQIVRVEAIVLPGRHGVALVDAVCPSPREQVWLELTESPDAVEFDDALWAEQSCNMRQVRADMTGRLDASSGRRVLHVTKVYSYQFEGAERSARRC